jgi:Protein of unknown function (DUF3014)
MTSIDDLPLDTGRGSDVVEAPSAPSSPGPRAVVGAVVALSLALAVGLYVGRSGVTAPGAPSDSQPTPATPDDPATAGPVGVALPPMSEMDPLVRGLFSALSTQPALLAWLASDDLTGAIATAIVRLAGGESPARDLAVLRPAQGFGVARRSGVAYVDPASYARYASLVQAVTSVDAARLATVFTTLKPRIVEAYVAQGNAADDFDAAVARALGIVVATPDVPADAALVPGVGGFEYANAAYEGLSPAQKHLIRMGPAQARAVRDAVTRFAAALGVQPVRP